jgi:type IV secretion system protein TrbL
MRTPWVPWFTLNPLEWLGDAASEVVGEAWTAAMVASWSSGMWVLRMAFTVIDSATTPDLTGDGPMGSVYPYTFGLGLTVALTMGFTQIGVAAYRRDGQSLGRLLVGIAQFGAVWLGYVGVAAALVTAAAGLTHGLLQGMMEIDSFAGYQPGSEWPRQVNDTVTATVLGICAWLLIWPSAILYLLLMLVREAALMLLAATSPIAAGGLLSDVGRAWFWKSLRWFIAALLIAPLSALVLGVGQTVTEAVVAGAGKSSEAAVGMAVVGAVIIMVGALCPFIVFRLLSFVDPGTSSGAAMRASMASHGGARNLLSGGAEGGSPIAARGDGMGRSAGEASADAATSSRFAAAGSAAATGAGVVVAAVGAVSKATHAAVNVSTDVLSSTGIGDGHPYYPHYAPDRRHGGPPPQVVVGRDSAEGSRADPPEDASSSAGGPR